MDNIAEELAAAHARIEQLENQLISTRMAWASDYDIMRISVRRVLTSNVEHLADALDALKQGQPEVTAEFVERSARRMRSLLDTVLQPHKREN